MLTERGVSFQGKLGATLARGTVAFINVSDDVKHDDFMTDAWVKHPLGRLLRRVRGFPRAGGGPAGYPKKN